MKEKPQPHLGLDMPFDEALARFIGTAPSELPAGVLQKKRQPKPPPKVVDEKDPKGPA